MPISHITPYRCEKFFVLNAQVEENYPTITKVGNVEITHIRAYWLRICSMLIKVFSTKFSGIEERNKHSLEFDS